jgi:uncharacterized membrane protein YfcA
MLDALPEGVPPLAAALVIGASFFTSALTASFGLGGGLALLAAMSAAFPPAAVIPVHGVAQLGSNAGRFLLQRRYVAWSIVAPFVAGAAIGSAIGARIFVALPTALLQGAVGVFVLASVWGPKPRGFAPGPRAFFATGAISSVLSMFFGATGPIAAAMLSNTGLERMPTVATHAAVMVFQHALKTVAFGIVGFAFADWALLLLAIVAAGFAGTTLGVKALQKMPEAMFRRGFRYVLTFFGVYLVVTAAL